MEQEIWKPVVNYEGLYEVSNLGRVKSINYRNTGKEGIMKPTPAKIGGYLQVGLRKSGKHETCLVHILIMRAFFGECPEGCEVDHYDWNPSNNRLSNLSYQPKGANRARKSPEWYKNIAEANKKLTQNQEWLRKNAEAREKMYQDPGWRKNHAEAIRKRCCKPVDQYALDGEYVKTWTSAADAARELGLHQSKISSCCNGKRKTTGDYIWRYTKKEAG